MEYHESRGKRDQVSREGFDGHRKKYRPRKTRMIDFFVYAQDLYIDYFFLFLAKIFFFFFGGGGRLTFQQ